MWTEHSFKGKNELSFEILFQSFILYITKKQKLGRSLFSSSSLQVTFRDPMLACIIVMGLGSCMFIIIFIMMLAGYYKISD